VKRREFITLLGGAALACPLPARAQQPGAVSVVGFLSSASPEPFEQFAAALRRGLNQSGYIEDRNLVIEFRWAENRYERLPAMAADLVRRQVAVIVASGANPPIAAAKAATSTIPIVFTGADDPVRHGLVASLNRPGGNVTGIIIFSAELEAKRLGLLLDLAPPTTTVAALLNPNNPNFDAQVEELRQAQRAAARQLTILQAGTSAEIDAAFQAMVTQRTAAFLVGSDPFLMSVRQQIIVLASRHPMPAIYPFREFAVAGGLISYGSSLTEAYRQTGLYVARILKGEKPADLPVIQPTRFELVINLKTVRAFGIDIPAKLLALSDEVIE
jgi:putative ABC transport system substrate-binding protein